MATTSGTLVSDIKSPYSGPYVHYSCTYTSTRANATTKTISVDCVSDTPTEFCAKSGAGYAKITPVLFDFAS